MKIKDKYLFIERLAIITSLLLIWIILIAFMTWMHNNNKGLEFSYFLFSIGTGLTFFTYYRYSYGKMKRNKIKLVTFKKRLLVNLYFLSIVNISILVLFIIGSINKVNSKIEITNDDIIAIISQFILICILSFPNILYLYSFGKKFIKQNDLPKWLNNLLRFIKKTYKIIFNNLFRYFQKCRNKLIKLKLNPVEIIIVSLLIGLIFSLLSGWYFGKIIKNDFNFNYFAIIYTFLISAGISYLIINRLNKKKLSDENTI
jgi:hypothetical protein